MIQIKQTKDAFETTDKKLVGERIIDFRDLINSNNEFRLHFEIYDEEVDNGFVNILKVTAYNNGDYSKEVFDEVFEFEEEFEAYDMMNELIQKGEYIPDWYLDNCCMAYNVWLNELETLLNCATFDIISDYESTTLGESCITTIDFIAEVEELTEEQIKLLTNKGYEIVNE